MERIKTVNTYGNICYLNERGELHREDGPAYIGTSGYKEWRINRLLHREDGPAVIDSNGKVSYYLNGIYYTKEDWEEEVIKLKLMRLKDL